HRMYSAMTANAPKMYRELSPSDMLNAAPGLNASVKRTKLPITWCGMCAGTRYRTASALVMTSQTMMATAAVQNTRLLLPVVVTCRSWLRELPTFGADGRRRYHCV